MPILSWLPNNHVLFTFETLISCKLIIYVFNSMTLVTLVSKFFTSCLTNLISISNESNIYLSIQIFYLLIQIFDLLPF